MRFYLCIFHANKFNLICKSHAFFMWIICVNFMQIFQCKFHANSMRFILRFFEINCIKQVHFAWKRIFHLIEFHGKRMEIFNCMEYTAMECFFHAYYYGCVYYAFLMRSLNSNTNAWITHEKRIVYLQYATKIPSFRLFFSFYG